MKNNYYIIETVIAVVLIGLAVALLNPFGWWMPDMLAKMIMVGLLIIFAVLVGFVWGEKARDEREMLHTMIAGRFAFLVGVAVLIAGIVVQNFNHAIDPWLVGALGTMVLAKVFGLVYGQTRH